MLFYISGFLKLMYSQAFVLKLQADRQKDNINDVSRIVIWRNKMTNQPIKDDASRIMIWKNKMTNQPTNEAFQFVSDNGNSFSSILLERILLGSNSFLALLYASTGKRLLNLSLRAASSSLSFRTCTYFWELLNKEAPNFNGTSFCPF